MRRSSIAAGFVGALVVMTALTACGSDSSGSGDSPSSPPSSMSMSMSMPASPDYGGGGGGAASSSSGGDTAATAGKLVIKDFDFSGKLTVKAGEKVTVVNEDTAAHTVTADKDKAFDTGTIEGGGTGSFTAPTKPGKYPFGCNFHPNMAGTLTVTA